MRSQNNLLKAPLILVVLYVAVSFAIYDMTHPGLTLMELFFDHWQEALLWQKEKQ